MGVECQHGFCNRNLPPDSFLLPRTGERRSDSRHPPESPEMGASVLPQCTADSFRSEKVRWYIRARESSSNL